MKVGNVLRAPTAGPKGSKGFKLPDLAVRSRVLYAAELPRIGPKGTGGKSLICPGSGSGTRDLTGQWPED